MRGFFSINNPPAVANERLHRAEMNEPPTKADPELSLLNTYQHTTPTQPQKEEPMASWVVRNRKRLAYESTFINQARQLHENKMTTAEPAVYPHALAIRLAKRGAIESEEKHGVDYEQRRSSSVSSVEDGVKAEPSSFV